MPRTQRSKRRHASRTSGLSATLLVAGVLIVGIIVLGVLANRDIGLGTRVREVAGPSTASGSPSPTAPTTSRSARPAGPSSSATASQPEQSVPATPASTPVAVPPTPYVVVPGREVRAKTEAEIQAEEAAQAAREQEKMDAQSFTFTLGSFNVLGSQHTAPGGDHPRYPPASTRSVGAARLIAAHGVDILGTQETQPDQLNALTSSTGMAAYPGYAFGEGETDNSILYDTSRFEFVSGSSFIIRFMNADRPQTVLRLRDRGTGREFYVVNMHASAGEGQYAVSRAAGHERAIAEVNELKETGLPVFLTGDMNDREDFYCRVAPPTGLIAAIGGSTSGGCSPARALAVDWVMGTDVTWSDYWEDRSPLGTISDHHFVSATATVEGNPPS